MSGWETVKAMVRERDRDRLRRQIETSDPQDRVAAMTAPPAECDCECCLTCVLRPLRFNEDEGHTVAERAYRKGWNDALRNAVEQLTKNGWAP